MEDKDKRKHPRQSKDFAEIINLQTDMEVAQEHWDQVFHNWDDPTNCSLKKQISGCSVCSEIEKYNEVTRKSTGEKYGGTGKISTL